MAFCAQCGTKLDAGARFCPSCGAPVTAATGPAPEPSEQRKLATLLFADLVGSTALGEGDPEQTRARLDRFYDAVAEEIERVGGTVEKFAGDAVMAAFGAPQALEDHPERALHAALALRTRVERDFHGQLQLRIGVNTGEVVVGRAREGSSFVSGDAVNVAARLEQAAEPGQILAGERTAAAARGAFEFAEPETIAAKGKSAGVVCRRLIRPLGLMRPRGVVGLCRAFVGRDAELKELVRTYRRTVERNEPELMTLLGDAGIGKTTLVRELWRVLGEEQSEPLRRTGRCLSYGEGVTYWPLAEILREQLGLLEDDPEGEILRHLRGRELLGLTFGLDVARDLHPLVARERFQDAWVEFLQELAAERPAVLLIEDLHWAEEPLFDLLEHVLHAASGPLLVIGTGRPELLERRPSWGGAVGGRLLRLETLPRADAGRMAAALLGAEPPPELRRVFDAAEGNPFFLEEIVATLIERGLLERVNNGWTAAELAEHFPVPDTVHALVAARIDLLPDAEREALQAASVIGRIFWTGPLYELLAGIEPDLRLLEQRDFVRRRSGSSIAGEREYALKHAITREVAYAGLPKARRARLHVAFAEWLERRGGEDRDAALLAHHYAEAVRPDVVALAWESDEAVLERLRASAVRWLRRAAELAIGRYELDDGVELLSRAIELEVDTDARADLWRTVAHGHALRYDGPRFMEAMESALQLATDRPTRAQIYSDLAWETATRTMWQTPPDVSRVIEWADAALELAEPVSRERARALMAPAHIAGAEAPAEAEELAERLGDREVAAGLCATRTLAGWAKPDAAAADEWAQRGLALADEARDPDGAAMAYSFAAFSALAAGRVEDALGRVERSAEINARLSAHHRLHGEAFRLSTRGLIGAWEAAAASQPRIEEVVAESAEYPCEWRAVALFWAALASARLDGGAEAKRLEEQGEAISLPGDWPEWQYAPLRMMLALLRGDMETAERRLRETDDHPKLYWNVPFRLEALLALGERDSIEEEAPPLLLPGTYLEPFALRTLGAARREEGVVRQAVDRFRALGLDWHAEQTEKLLG